MSSELAGLVLAAGAGTRLRPLTDLRPKPLCPVGNVALLDLALNRVATALRAASAHRRGEDPAVAVNLSHGRAAIEAHLDQLEDQYARGRRGLSDAIALHRSVEPVALGTAGAVGPLRRWLDGRSLLIVNADTWCPAPLGPLVQGWDGRSITVAVSGPPPLGARSGVVASILPWSEVVQIPTDPEPCGLWERFWRQALAEDRLVSVGVDGPFVDCGTPAEYLRANLAAAELGPTDRNGCLIHPSATMAPTAVLRRSVVGPGATVAGQLDRCVVWAGATVAAGEDLQRCIRTGPRLTVQVDVVAS
ncbi:MAG: NDP-sugar synthase [Acidimicrobiales bacterium]